MNFPGISMCVRRRSPVTHRPRLAPLGRRGRRHHRCVRRIFPEPAGDASLDALYGGPRQRVDGRPWVGVCMVASLDGSTVVEGRSGGCEPQRHRRLQTPPPGGRRRAGRCLDRPPGRLWSAAQARPTDRGGDGQRQRGSRQRAVRQWRRLPDHARGRPSTVRRRSTWCGPGWAASIWPPRCAGSMT